MAEPVSTCVHEIFELSPSAKTALGHEVVDPAFAFFIAGVPVLNGRVFHRGIFHRIDLYHGGVQLVLIAHGAVQPSR